MRAAISILVALSAPLQATLLLFVPATDGYVLCGDRGISDVRTKAVRDTETKVRSIRADLAWTAVGNTAFYDNADGTVFWDTFATTASVVRTRPHWEASEIVAAVKARLVEEFRDAFQRHTINVEKDMSLFQTLVYSVERDGVRTVLTTYFFQPPNVLVPYDDAKLVNRVTGWGSGSAVLAELWRGKKPEFDGARANKSIMNFLNEKPRLPVADATMRAREVIKVVSEHAHLFPNVGVSPTADCITLPLAIPKR